MQIGIMWTTGWLKMLLSTTDGAATAATSAAALNQKPRLYKTVSLNEITCIRPTDDQATYPGRSSLDFASLSLRSHCILAVPASRSIEHRTLESTRSARMFYRGGASNTC